MCMVWAIPRSLAATQGIAVAFSSSGYLDVSVPPVGPLWPMCSARSDGTLPPSGFPIRKSPGQRLLGNSPELIAAYHVLHHLPTPRHPPFALSSLAKNIKKTLTLALGILSYTSHCYDEHDPTRRTDRVSNMNFQ